MMGLCVICGLQEASGVCAFHHFVYGAEWATSNRIWCDWLHRGIIPPRLSVADRDDNFWAAPMDACV